MRMVGSMKSETFLQLESLRSQPICGVVGPQTLVSHP